MGYKELVDFGAVSAAEPIFLMTALYEDLVSELRQLNLVGAWEGPLAEGAARHLVQLQGVAELLRTELDNLSRASQYERECRYLAQNQIASVLEEYLVPESILSKMGGGGL